MAKAKGGFGNTGRGWWQLNEQVNQAVAGRPAHMLGDYGVARGNSKWSMPGAGLGAAIAQGIKSRRAASPDAPAKATKVLPATTKMPTTPVQPLRTPPSGGGAAASAVRGAQTTGTGSIPFNVRQQTPWPSQPGASQPGTAPRRASFWQGAGPTEEATVVGGDREHRATNVRQDVGISVNPSSTSGRYQGMAPGLEQATAASPVTQALPRREHFDLGSGSSSGSVSLAGRTVIDARSWTAATPVTPGRRPLPQLGPGPTPTTATQPNGQGYMDFPGIKPPKPGRRFG